MKKKYILIPLCCILVVILILGGKYRGKYKRIRLENEFTQENIDACVGDDTVVINNATEVFPEQLPMYLIKERTFSQQDCDQMLDALVLPNNPDYLKIEGNSLYYNLASYTDFSRGYFSMSEEELEKTAWEIFCKIPFMQGEYEYIGIRETSTLNDASGDHITRVGVSFCRLLDGGRVVGNEQCRLYFDGTGLVAIRISRYYYTKIGTIKVVPLKDAEALIKSPDGFDVDGAEFGRVYHANTLQVDRVKLLLVNQYSEGCRILQPVYNFIGTASLENGTQAEFQSRIIAIPESYTYE